MSGKVSPLPDAVKARRGHPRARIADPLLALRYSAMHRNPYNLVYRLMPFEAYRQSLVEKIQIASVVSEDDFNQVFVRVEEICVGQRRYRPRSRCTSVLPANN